MRMGDGMQRQHMHPVQHIGMVEEKDIRGVAGLVC